MLFDGRQRARSLQDKLANQNVGGELVVVAIDPDPASMSYMRIKETVGERMGIPVRIDSVSAPSATLHVREIANYDSVGGIVVQLPLPSAVDTESLLAAIPRTKDPDALGPDPIVLSPVARAVLDIVSTTDIRFADAQVVVIGRGRLVGKPVADALYAKGAHLTIVDEHTNQEDLEVTLKNADLIISGAGVPGLIQPHMLKRGVVLIDAGTSEQGGVIVGDADPACESLCSLMTPVPGGVGPLAVTMLFANYIDLWNLRQ